MSTVAFANAPQERALHASPFEDGHALTFTVREIHDPAAEFLSRPHERRAAAYAFALAQKHARYVELRAKDGQVLADYVRGQGVQWYTPRRDTGGRPHPNKSQRRTPVAPATDVRRCNSAPKNQGMKRCTKTIK